MPNEEKKFIITIRMRGGVSIRPLFKFFKGEIIMNSVLRRAAALSIAAVLGTVSLAGCGRKAKVDGTKTVLTVNDETVRLGTASFLTRVQQANEYQTQLYYYYLYQQMGYQMGDPSHYFDEIADEETNKTYGEQMKDYIMENLEKMVVISQHADEYGVSLGDDTLSEIDRVAQSYIDGNSEEVLTMIGADKEDVVSALKYLTIQSEMMEPVVKDVDTEVSDEEAQQTSITYVQFNNPDAGSDTESGAESIAESAVESVAESVAEAVFSKVVEVEEMETVSSVESAAESFVESVESSVESVAEEAEEEPDPAVQAAAVLDALLAEPDPATADVDAIAKSVSETAFASNGHFTKADITDGTVNEAVAKAVQGLEDGEVVDHVVKSSDGQYLYVIRLDHTVDEDLTETKRTEVIAERKTTAFDETVQGWVDEAEIKVDEDVWKTVAVTDQLRVTIKQPEQTEEAVSEAEAAASDVSSLAEEVLSEVPEAETAESGVSAVEEPAE